MIRFFRFFSIAFPIMTLTAIIIATNIGITMTSNLTIGSLFVINVACGMFLGYDYQDKF